MKCKPIAPQPACLVPRPVGYYRGTDSQTQGGDEAQTPGGYQGPGRKQKHRSRYRQTYLVREYRKEQHRVSVLNDKLDDIIHIKILRGRGGLPMSSRRKNTKRPMRLAVVGSAGGFQTNDQSIR